MPLNIKDDETHEMARKLAGYTGVSLSKAVKLALKEKLARIEKAQNRARLADELDHIALYCAGLPVRDKRSSDDIIGYDDDGLPS